MYTFKINKSPESSNEEFESAVHCARGCVESVLDNEFLSVKVVEDTIVIHTIDQEQLIDMALSECKEKIKGCFCDTSDKLYPEFTQIDLEEK